MTVLVDWQIRQLRTEGEIIIEPFDERNLKSGSYDIRLGLNYYREQVPTDPSDVIVNPWNEESVKKMWGEPCVAAFGSDIEDEDLFHRLGIKVEDQFILLHPHETILAHTVEFIGGRSRIITNMQARSSIGRVMIEICKCAGWGDHGYFNAWTMEITNNSQHHPITLIVGKRVGQIIFMETKVPQQDYSHTGKYQTSPDLTTVMQNWEPSAMLPKMWLDWELSKRE